MGKKRWSIYVEGYVIQKAKELALANGQTIGDYIGNLINGLWDRKRLSDASKAKDQDLEETGCSEN